ncbi:type II toxin-antitoxin system RelE/ParE family toxin [Mucilaginibacter phyllosphaerae]|uniref:Plasmid stabilization system protein ParE n=1 Tax=Mucilaginibacter phyllosphaerae TaxID=1812349 RepID=A0A4Y8AKB0_9SPHI|nr:plasmid stabilization system protein ParE [Mucilaginibacter phyllosphaerae]TEW69448.1 type II toxin-antitoxin system RelE/ParE family toxin [Mucilaginibacter phyllosphaerae]
MILIKLIWSARALDEYERLLDYLMPEWGIAITKRVVDSITHQINRIQHSPEQFPIFIKSKNIHRCIISPQTSLFFKASDNTIEILSIFDNRQDPKKHGF